MTQLRERFIDELRLSGRGDSTIANYVSAVAGAATYHKRSPVTFSKDDVRAYLLHLSVERKLHPATINLHHAALGTFFKLMVPQSSIMDGIPKMKEPKRIPIVLSRDEVERLLDAIRNPKYKTATMLIYGGGLRLSECLRLKPHHIESSRMLIRVENGKGNKDRYTILSRRALDSLRAYYLMTRPEHWLFPGRGNNHLSKRMLEKAITDGVKRAGIKREATAHTLRHSFATHLVEAGVALPLIQRLLGHASIKTTTIYTHVTKIMWEQLVSPIDMPHIVPDSRGANNG